MGETDLVYREENERITTIRLNRPPVNALDIALVSALERELQLSNRSDTGAILLTGSGTCFSAGLDLKKLPSYGANERTELVNLLNQLMLTLYSLPRPVVAAVNGHAIAGGFILMAACDYRILCEEATVGVTEVKVGVPFPGGPLEVLKAEMPPGAARYLALSGALVDARRALALGVVDEVRPAGELNRRALEVAGEFSTLPPAAFSRIKRQLRDATIERMQTIVKTTDPVLHFWQAAAIGETAARVLDKRT